MIWDNFSIFRTNCVIACGTRAYIAARICRAGEMAFEIPEIVYAVGPQLKFMEVGILLTYFAVYVSCSSLSEDSAEFRYVPLYITDQVEFRCCFCKNFTLLQSKFHI